MSVYFPWMYLHFSIMCTYSYTVTFNFSAVHTYYILYSTSHSNISRWYLFIEYDESTACGSPSLLLCDDECRTKADIYCNNNYDCSDWFDEFMCAGDSVTCDFESSPTCGYTLESKGDHQYTWVYNNGDTDTPDTGPPHDHTYRNESGKHECKRTLWTHILG